MLERSPLFESSARRNVRAACRLLALVKRREFRGDIPHDVNGQVPRRCSRESVFPVPLMIKRPSVPISPSFSAGNLSPEGLHRSRVPSIPRRLWERLPSLCFWPARAGGPTRSIGSQSAGASRLSRSSEKNRAVASRFCQICGQVGYRAAVPRGVGPRGRTKLVKLKVATWGARRAAEKFDIDCKALHAEKLRFRGKFRAKVSKHRTGRKLRPAGQEFLDLLVDGWASDRGEFPPFYGALSCFARTISSQFRRTAYIK